jgi:hypothetical protein
MRSKDKASFVSIGPGDECCGSVLLSYIIEPFLLKDGEPVSAAHTHDWESLQIGKTFVDLGYAVDVIDYRDSIFCPKKEYSFFIGARTNFERICRLLNKNCTKIVHLDTAHWLFNNSAAYSRCLALQKRRGVSLRSFKWVAPNWAIEHANCATMLGNSFTINTYTYAEKPIYRIPISTCAVYPWPEQKDFNECRKGYLWFGSHGLVHKGLDLVLECFTDMPDYELYVCGPIEDEEGFEKAFYEELYRTPNIHNIGWVDVRSERFMEIANKCVGIIYPSCSEGGGGSVIQCMHAGLIPIVTNEASVDTGNFGLVLGNCSTEEVKHSIQMLSGFSPDKLKLLSKRTWEFARENHTRERFAKECRRIVEKIIAIHHEKKNSYKNQIS